MVGAYEGRGGTTGDMSRPWSADPTVVLGQRLLAWMVDEDREVSNEAAAAAMGVPAAEMNEAGRNLVALGLIKMPDPIQRAQRTAQPTLSSTARAMVRSWDVERQSASARKRACQAAILSWLDARYGQRVNGLASEFMDDPRSRFYGEPLDQTVIFDAARDLHRHGLISGRVTAQLEILRPAITDLGMMVLERHGGDVVAWLAEATSGSRGGTNVTISGSTGVAVALGSPGARQTVQVTNDLGEALLGIANALTGSLPVLGLEPVEEVQARGLVVELKDLAAQAEPDRGRVQRAFDQLRGLAVAGTGNAVGTGIVALVEQAAQLLT